MGFIRDIGALTKSFTALTPAVITAAAGNDGSELTGITVDRLLAGRGFAHSAKLVISFVVTTASGKKLTVTANAEHGNASNMTDTADYAATRAQFDMSSSGTITAITLSSGAVPATDVAGASLTAAAGQVEIDFDLSSAKRYIRIMVTLDLSNTSTDTVAYSAAWILGGFAVVPPVTN
jgi:hypothetical protein